jgi:hypothetical protein
MASLEPYILLAYSDKDSDFADQLNEALLRHGKRTWTDRQNIRGAEEWHKGMESAVRAAEVLLILMSPEFMSSERLEHYLELAQQHHRPIIPILYRSVTSDAVPHPLAKLQWIDFQDRNKFEISLAKLLDAIDFQGREALEQTETAEGSPVTGSETAKIIKLLAEGSDRPEELSCTPSLAQLLALAARIARRNKADFDISFSSILNAFVYFDIPLLQWFKVYVREAKIDLGALLSRQNMNPEELSSVTKEPITEKELGETWRQTISAKSLFQAAQEFRDRVIGDGRKEPLDTRHLMAAYIYRPTGHEAELESLRLNRPAWSNAFLGLMAQFYSSEIEKWKEIHIQTFPSNPPEIPISVGPSTHIATDIWTLSDTLGYRAYVYAIYRFMTHPQTKPPLTISIQAPWGGGKTSLMRMIQKMLDPDALQEVKEETQGSRFVFTLKEALKEIEEWILAGPKNKLAEIPKDKNRKLLTVWFNAWKYESTNQVWAGLADAVMQQVSARLSPVDREKFWLRLNLKRVDADKIRQRIHQRILNYFWRGLRVWVFGYGIGLILSVSITLIGSFIQSSLASLAKIVGWGGIGSLFLSTAISSVRKYRDAKEKVEKEPAMVSLNEYLDIPDYRKELGFIHYVEADLQRVLACIPNEHRPIVIFIDDLDRCSPAKVAQVVEGVNLFLAGDFPQCIFLLGMDTEMVAAALQAAHKDMIACLPSDAGIPVGWRFMDKFVQLPFLIPPTEEVEVTRYTKSLFESNEALTIDPKIEEIASESAKHIFTRSDAADETLKLQSKLNLDEAQRGHLQEQLEAHVVQRKLDEGIETFTDKNPEIQRVISVATSYFRGNPRELKRFINSFRFHYFIWWARRAQELESPSLEQLLRWTVLSMKWPEVVRWLRRSGGTDWCLQCEGGQAGKAVPTLTSRLRLIEVISGGATDLTSWQKEALETFRLTPKDASWLNDDDLLQFFYEEYTKHPEGHRLSDAEGKGLW